ncbi:hypothetical protein P7F88_25260 [Vibrio hannami]|uniref:hypothetical protein n=1 Tax=Vibrio hannami TaxID=2717094 RepID=UPI00240F5CE9|nr:hypothetical protein [Vibrio hannami]MDG3089174.1 hypothetical protein [Vibrio hannami]
MKHGVVSPAVLKKECNIIAQALGDGELGHFLWEICSIESDCGLKGNRFGGVCNISFEMYKLMLGHNRIFKIAETIQEAFGINMHKVQYQQLHMSPNLSLIFAAAWFRCYYERIPKEPAERALIFSQYWRPIDVIEYFSQAAICQK